MSNKEQLQHRLHTDTATMLRLIAQVAPNLGLGPDEIARLDQVAAHAAKSTGS